MNAQRMDELITRHSTIMDCYDPSRRIGLVVDEWGTWFDVEPGTNPGFLYQQNTLRDALVAGLHFDIFHRHARRLVMANIAQTVNVLQAVLLTDGAQLIRTPTYHVFEMNKRHHDATRLDVHFASPVDARPVGDLGLRTLSMSASTKDGSALLSLTNLDAESARTVEVDLRGGAFEVGRARVLTAAQLADHNTAERPGLVAPQDLEEVKRSRDTLTIQVPAHSFVTVELESVGGQLKTWQRCRVPACCSSTHVRRRRRSGSGGFPGDDLVVGHELLMGVRRHRAGDPAHQQVDGLVRDLPPGPGSTEDNDGTVNAASATLSKPITFTCPGTSRPRSASPRRTPIAVVSVTQNTPSNSTPRAASPRTASAPASMLNTSQVHHKVGGERNLRPTKGLTVALEAASWRRPPPP